MEDYTMKPRIPKQDQNFLEMECFDPRLSVEVTLRTPYSHEEPTVKPTGFLTSCYTREI